VYAAGFVDRAVAPLGHNVRPEYPVALRAAGVEGEVQVRFVVNSAGFVEPATIEILRATHAQFAAVVRRWLPITRYVPAEARGRRVRQLVEQRVGFTLQQ
jgi:TonB family protein